MNHRTLIAALAAVAMLGTSAHAADARKDIVDTAVAAGNFKTLATALTAAGLIDTLKGTGPFTVFAPTDEAFAKLPAGTLDALLKDKAIFLLRAPAREEIGDDAAVAIGVYRSRGGSVWLPRVGLVVEAVEAGRARRASRARPHAARCSGKPPDHCRG